MHDLPVAEVLAIRLHGDEDPQCIASVRVRCPYCEHPHPHRVFADETTAFDRTAPCSGNSPVLRYRINLNTRVPMCRSVSGPHLVAGTGRDDNAIDVPVPNWTE